MKGARIREKGRHGSEVSRWPKGTYWASHIAYYAGTGTERDLIAIAPVSRKRKGGRWEYSAYLGHQNLTPEKLKGRGKTREDPICMEARFKTILDVMGLGVLVKKPRRKATTSQATARTNNDQILEVELCKMPAADLVTAQQSADKGEGKEKADWQVSTVSATA